MLFSKAAVTQPQPREAAQQRAAEDCICKSACEPCREGCRAVQNKLLGKILLSCCFRSPKCEPDGCQLLKIRAIHGVRTALNFNCEVMKKKHLSREIDVGYKLIWIVWTRTSLCATDLTGAVSVHATCKCNSIVKNLKKNSNVLSSAPIQRNIISILTHCWMANPSTEVLICGYMQISFESTDRSCFKVS